MKNRISQSLAIVITLVSISAVASAQCSSGGGGRPKLCPPVYPVRPVNPPVYPENPGYPGPPVTQSYFLGVYTSTTRVNSGPSQNPGYGPLSNQVQPRVVPGYGQDVFGQRINRIVPNSPAYHAGLEPGDVILDGNGYSMDSRNDLQHAINSSRGSLEMKVLDARTNQIMWVVARTDSQSTTPSVARGTSQRYPTKQAATQYQPTNYQPTYQRSTQPAQSFQQYTTRRAPIRRGQR